MKNDSKNLSLSKDLIPEILMRLPVKSLVRFRCVSKSWLSLINNPQFAKLHFEKVVAPTDRLILLTEEWPMKAQSIDLKASLSDDSATVKLNPQLPTPSFGFTIMGSCRGFIILHYYSKYFIIWNPSTNVHRIISKSPIARNIQKNLRGSIYKFILAHGFGYDAAMDDYLVVVVSMDIADKVTHFELFSTRTNSWKEIEGIHYSYMSYMDKNGLFFNEAIHWICCAPISVIIMLDLIQRNFSEIRLPNRFTNYGSQLTVLGGCLSLCSWSREQKTEIWVMKEYKVESSWTKVFVVPIHEALLIYFSPLCFTKYGEVVGLFGTKKIAKFTNKAELLEERTYFECLPRLNVAMYTENLLSLPSDCGEAYEEDQ